MGYDNAFLDGGGGGAPGFMLTVTNTVPPQIVNIQQVAGVTGEDDPNSHINHVTSGGGGGGGGGGGNEHTVNTEPPQPIYPSPPCTLTPIPFEPFAMFIALASIQSGYIGGVITGYNDECGPNAKVFAVRIESGNLVIEREGKSDIVFNLGYRLEGDVFIYLKFVASSVWCTLWNGYGDYFHASKYYNTSNLYYNVNDLMAVYISGHNLEGEVMKPVPSDDYAETTKNFYFNPPEISSTQIQVGVDSSYNYHLVDNIGISDFAVNCSHINLVGESVGVAAFEINDAAHMLESDGVGLSSGHRVVPADSKHVLASDEVSGTKLTISATDAAHDLASETPRTSGAGFISPYDANHALVSDEISPSQTATIIGSFHELHSEGGLILAGKQTIVVYDPANEHHAESPALSTPERISPYDAEHVLASETPDVFYINSTFHELSEDYYFHLNEKPIIGANDSAIVQSADIIRLASADFISPANSAHAHASDEISGVTSVNAISHIYDGLQRHFSDNVSGFILKTVMDRPWETVHTLSSDILTFPHVRPDDAFNPLFSQEVWGGTVDDSTHIHESNVVALTQRLTPRDSHHETTSQIFDIRRVVQPDDAYHAFFYNETLIVDDSLNELHSDELSGNYSYVQVA